MNAKLQKIAEETKDARKKVRGLVRIGQWTNADEDETRKANFFSREKRLTGSESIQNSMDWQESNFLPIGAEVRKAVAYVEVNTAIKSTIGSGFMISPSLFITNAHVIEDIESAQGAKIYFNRENNADGLAEIGSAYCLDPDKFFHTTKIGEYDFSLIAIGDCLSGIDVIANVGYCPISNMPNRHVVGMNVNIIHHPLSLFKKISIRNNLLVYRTPKTLLYETDTEEGSSGSLVCNDSWEVIALHHWGEPFLEEKDEYGRDIPKTVNEGVRISYIYDYLASILQPQLASPQKDLLDEALSLAKNKPKTNVKVLVPKHKTTPLPTIKSEFMENNNANKLENTSRQIRLTIPIEVVVTVGDVNATDIKAAQLPSSALKQEAIKIDPNYENRTSYQSDFITGYDIPLPKIGSDLLPSVAPLKPSEKNYQDGVLNYEHFSLVVNSDKRTAFYTATNIDGDTYLQVNRDTGKVSKNKDEGETWYKDRRMDERHYLLQNFFSEWSHLFDRGHLTRRTDPTWGSAETAERANADTYHFTNCSTQHFRFNQTTKFWQGLEQYVLEHGALSGKSGKRLTVFQGPIFNDSKDLMADDFQIPSSFFKIIVWESTDGLKAVGLVADQIELLGEERKKLGGPKTEDHVDVNQWRVKIADIERRTKLNFGDAVRSADTIAQQNQPSVGEALGFKITKMEDIVL